MNCAHRVQSEGPRGRCQQSRVEKWRPLRNWPPCPARDIAPCSPTNYFKCQIICIKLQWDQTGSAK
eukprot:5812344-Pyramimonas_sp.AAC.1